MLSLRTYIHTIFDTWFSLVFYDSINVEVRYTDTVEINSINFWYNHVKYIQIVGLRVTVAVICYFTIQRGTKETVYMLSYAIRHTPYANSLL